MTKKVNRYALLFPINWQKSTWLHLRFPFSLFLLPVYAFAIAIAQPDWSDIRLLLSFFVLHFLVYPASNGYNSFYDKDEGSIGGLKHPPKVGLDLLYASWLLDILALIISVWIGLPFFFGVLVYGIMSKAYSHPAIRLKKFAFTGWFIAGFFQGGFTFWMVTSIWSVDPWRFWESGMILWGILLATAIFFGPYPMTQIYQHEEDAKRGDKTISLLLGVRGTFLFTMNFFGVAIIGLVYYIYHYFSIAWAITLGACMLPVLIFFFWWMYQCWKDPKAANFENTMRLNMISSLCMFGYFLVLYFL